MCSDREPLRCLGRIPLARRLTEAHGVPSIIDKDGHAVLIDCRSLEMRDVPIPPSAAVMVLDTATRRELVESAVQRAAGAMRGRGRGGQDPSLRSG